jgi:hypothetical protein
MIYGIKQIQNTFGKSITLEYTKIGSTTKIRQDFIGTFEKMSDEALREQTTYNKDSMIFKILCVDLISKLNTIKIKNLNVTIYCNNIKYNVVSEELSSDEVLLKLYSNTV